MSSSKKSNNVIKYVLLFSVVILVILVLVVIFKKPSKIAVENQPTRDNNRTDVTAYSEPATADPFLNGSNIDRQLLTVSEYSRPGKPLKQVNAIVIHYVGNPGTSAWHNRQYFESLKDTKETAASSHYIVGLYGEIIQCVPLDEISYCSNSRNSDTIAIECCHPDSTGRFNDETYRAAVRLTAALCNTYGLAPEKDILRHYDITNKLCPLYFVEHEDEWYRFKMDVKAYMAK